MERGSMGETTSPAARAVDPFAETNTDAPSQAKPAPAKRSLFKNRKPKVVKSAEEEAAEAVDFFSRSKEVFPEALREKRERREREERRKSEREEQRRREEDEERERERERERKGRRYVPEPEEEGGGRAGERRNYSASRSVTSPRHRSISQDSNQSGSPPAKRRSPRNGRRTRPQRGTQSIIPISSDEDDDDLRIAKQRSLASGSRTQYENDTSSHSFDPFEPSPPRAVPQKRKSPSPTPLPQDEDEMFPELVAAARAQAAQERAAALKTQRKISGQSKTGSSTGSGKASPYIHDLDSPAPTASSPLATREVPREDPVICIYIDSRLEGYGEAIIVKRKLSQRFKDVRMAWCDKQRIQGHRSMTDIEKEGIFLSWRGRKVWDVTTAESLGIRVDSRGKVVDDKGIDLGANVHLEAWTQEAYDKWQREKKAEKLRIAEGAPEKVDISDDEEPQTPATQETAAAAPGVEKIKIILKPRTGEPVKLIVKTSTLVETIINGFRVQRAGLCEGKKVELWFDGERLGEASTVGDADVEDLSGVDVVLRDV